MIPMRYSSDGYAWDEPLTRAAVTGRSGGICEWCRQDQATDMHHRINRSQGGWWSPANIVHLCRFDHATVTNIPTWAKIVGLSVDPFSGGQSTDPATVPIQVVGTGADLWLTDLLIAKAGARA